MVGGLAALLTANAVVLRIGLAPLPAARPGHGRRRPAAPRGPCRGRGTGRRRPQLITTYNAMLDRLEAERAASAARALSAQESERHRIAQGAARRGRPDPDRRAAPAEARRRPGARTSCARNWARRRRPPGPVSTRSAASPAGCGPASWRSSGCSARCARWPAEFTTHGLTVRHASAPGLPPLTEETELVLYRVAQEALTNTARHSGADRGRSAPAPGRRRASSSWYATTARGWARRPRAPGSAGMRERALLIGASSRSLVGTARHGAGGTRDGQARRRRRQSVARRDPRNRRSRRRPLAIGGMPPIDGAEPTPPRPACLLADDHTLVRRGVRLILDGEPDLTVVAEAGDGAEAVELARARDGRPRRTGHRHAPDDRPAGGPRTLPAPAGPAHPDPDDVRQRAVLLRGPQGGRQRIRPQVGRRPRPGRGVPGRRARRAVRLPGRRDGRSSAPTSTGCTAATTVPAAGRSPSARRRSSSSSRRATPRRRSASCCSSAPRRSSGTGRTCCRSSACATGWS